VPLVSPEPEADWQNTAAARHSGTELRGHPGSVPVRPPTARGPGVEQAGKAGGEPHGLAQLLCPIFGLGCFFRSNPFSRSIGDVRNLRRFQLDSPQQLRKNFEHW
jgi:hypothetical protein